MTEDDARERVHTEPDFVNSKRHEYSLKKLEERYPDGAPDNVIANALMIKEEEVEPEFDKVVVKMRKEMGVENDD